MSEGKQRFRIGVLTILEVEVTSDERDARRVAEGTLAYVIGESNVADRGGRPVIRWHHRNGADYEAQVVRQPIELGAAARNGYFDLTVHQPTQDVSDGR